MLANDTGQAYDYMHTTSGGRTDEGVLRVFAEGLARHGGFPPAASPGPRASS